MGVVCGIVILFIGASVLPATETINNPRKNDIVIYPNFIKTITVDDEGDGDYTRIQNAINHANFGDTIEVYSGTYVENVVVDKMIDLVGKDYELGSGSDTGKPVIDGSGTGTVVKTTSDGVKITGFMIQHSGSSDPGIHLASHYNIIQDNVVTGNFYGMKLFPSTGNEITCNIISNNSGDGLWLSHSHENTIENNSITGNANDGISANLSSLSNHIEYNYIAENKGRGIELSETSFGSKIKMNNITKNTIGFETTGGSDNNLFHLNNLIKNVQNAKDNSANRYDDNGMGNYWDDYTGVDDDGDGIGDTPYVVPGEGENQDDYPFMAPLVINYAPLKPDPPKGPADGQGKVG
jgi:parallel beta-helix repeat protein